MRRSRLAGCRLLRGAFGKKLTGTGANYDLAVSASTTWGPNGLADRYVNATGTKVYYQCDPLGNVIQRLDENNNVLSASSYDSFGNTDITAMGGDPFGYKGKFGYYTDAETGLILCLHRYYDPATGRWLTRDPIGYAGGLNLYGYCGNEPVGGVDASGYYSTNIGYYDETGFHGTYSVYIDNNDSRFEQFKNGHMETYCRDKYLSSIGKFNGPFSVNQELESTFDLLIRCKIKLEGYRPLGEYENADYRVPFIGRTTSLTPDPFIGRTTSLTPDPYINNMAPPFPGPPTLTYDWEKGMESMAILDGLNSQLSAASGYIEFSALRPDRIGYKAWHRSYVGPGTANYSKALEAGKSGAAFGKVMGNTLTATGIAINAADSYYNAANNIQEKRSMDKVKYDVRVDIGVVMVETSAGPLAVAGIGAACGSFAPGVGTAIGAGVGLATWGILDGIKWDGRRTLHQMARDRMQ